MNVALVHDHLNQFGGAEKVLMNFHAIYPKSPIYTLLYDAGKLPREFQGLDVRTSFIASLPYAKKRFKWYLTLMPVAFEHFNFSAYDVVLSSVSGLAKGILVDPHAIHVCYCHTPTRYLWSDTHTYTEELRQPWFIKKMLPPVLTRLRMWDYIAAQRVDYFIANSAFVAGRIKKYYRRDAAAVIYPPVETGKFSIAQDIGDYYLVISRMRPYKRVDMVVRAFNKLGLPLKIIGTGEEEKKLKSMARGNIEFLGALSDKQKAVCVSRCRALLFPQEEDFGIVAVEAMAAGRPVIAYKGGGVVESMVEGVTGAFFDEQSWEALADTVIKFDHRDFDPRRIREHALTFDEAVFRKKISEFIQDKNKQKNSS